MGLLMSCARGQCAYAHVPFAGRREVDVAVLCLCEGEQPRAFLFQRRAARIGDRLEWLDEQGVR